MTTPDHDMTPAEWGRIAVGIEDWRWMPGMLAAPTSHQQERWLICWADQQYTKTPDGWSGPHGWEGGGYKVDNGKLWGIGPSSGDPIDLSGDGWFIDPTDGPTGWLLFRLLGPGVSLKVRTFDGGGMNCTIVVPRELTPDGRAHAIMSSILGICAIKAARLIGYWPGGTP